MADTSHKVRSNFADTSLQTMWQTFPCRIAFGWCGRMAAEFVRRLSLDRIVQYSRPSTRSPRKPIAHTILRAGRTMFARCPRHEQSPEASCEDQRGCHSLQWLRKVRAHRTCVVKGQLFAVWAPLASGHFDSLGMTAWRAACLYTACKEDMRDRNAVDGLSWIDRG